MILAHPALDELRALDGGPGLGAEAGVGEALVRGGVADAAVVEGMGEPEGEEGGLEVKGFGEEGGVEEEVVAGVGGGV